MAIKLAAFRKLCKNMKRIKGDKLIHGSLKNSSIQQDIMDLNREDQLYDKGIDADGRSLGEYSSKTIEEKKKKGQRYDHITLSDTFEFYKSWMFKNKSDSFVFSAETKKGGEANADFGKIIQLSTGKFVQSSIRGTYDNDLMDFGNIIGLTEKNKGVVASWIRPAVASEIKKQLRK